jgi:uncharacterized protein YutE (UPF0331/DUF86 family)
MDEKLVTQLKLLKKYTGILKEIKEKEESEYLKDTILQGAAERYLQLSIESCINIGNRILSLEQLNFDIGVIETYTDIFKNLSQIGIIDNEFTENLIKMAKFRNRLVHVYWDMDNKFIYKVLQNNLSDLDRFSKMTANYIDNKGKDMK